MLYVIFTQILFSQIFNDRQQSSFASKRKSTSCVTASAVIRTRGTSMIRASSCAIQ